MYDVVIIGAGVSGSASARELSRYKVNACVIEKAEDCSCWIRCSRRFINGKTKCRRKFNDGGVI